MELSTSGGVFTGRNSWFICIIHANQLFHEVCMSSHVFSTFGCTCLQYFWPLMTLCGFYCLSAIYTYLEQMSFVYVYNYRMYAAIIISSVCMLCFN